MGAHQENSWPVAGWSASLAGCRDQEMFRLRVVPEDSLLAQNCLCFSFTAASWLVSSGGRVASEALRLVFGAGSTPTERFLPFLLTPVQGALHVGTSVPWRVGSGSR